jgi:hypothetical protein
MIDFSSKILLLNTKMIAKINANYYLWKKIQFCFEAGSFTIKQKNFSSYPSLKNLASIYGAPTLI